MSNYDGYCDSCGGGYGTSCGSGGCGCGNDYQACSPDYSPVTVNNSTCPNVEGSTSQGGSAQGGNSHGNSSTVNVSMCGCCNNNKLSCCRDGVKKLLQFLYDKSLDTSITVSSYIYGDILSVQDNLDAINNQQLLYLSDTDLQNISICDEIVITTNGVVSLCSISLIAFDFDGVNENLDIKKLFKYIKNSSCSCECGDAIAGALCFSGLGRTYDIVIQDALIQDTQGNLTSATLTGLILVAVDNNIAIFSDSLNQPSKYYGIPTCKIVSFKIEVQESGGE